jgi:hypothetical protein
VDFELEARQGAAVEEDVAPAGPGRTAALVAVLGMALALVLLPIAFGLGVGNESFPEQVAVGLGTLAAVSAGVKLAAVAWGLWSRFTARPESQLATASLD